MINNTHSENQPVSKCCGFTVTYTPVENVGQEYYCSFKDLKCSKCKKALEETDIVSQQEFINNENKK